MLLQDKVAIVYGGAGAIGGAVARAFAAEGARVHVTGRSLEAARAVVKDITANGGQAEAAEVDALDEAAIGRHLQDVVDRDGRVDISFNAVGIPDGDILGKPVTEIGPELFMRPVLAYTSSYFHTARLAARHMIPQGSGVIMTVTALLSRKGTTLNGGYGPAQAAKEALTRDLSAELAPKGIRVVGVRPHGMPEAESMRDVYDAKADVLGITWEQFQGFLAADTHPRRVMHLDEVATVAAFLASDRAGGMTGTTVNLTMGSLDD
ncbi:SDR family oxidoreductase [Catenulispora yoronensis]|uniref:SDR family oxidoreductase n=1 Tax=Catenulispora yoronensis TaxID=450799 RepID=A0ABP5FMB3_9ACTN